MVRRHIRHTAAVVAFGAGLWAAWQWSVRVQGIPRRGSPGSAAAVVSAVSAARAVATPGGQTDAAGLAAALTQQLATAAIGMRSRMLAIKRLAPEFRDNPIVRQFVEGRSEGPIHVVG